MNAAEDDGTVGFHFEFKVFGDFVTQDDSGFVVSVDAGFQFQLVVVGSALPGVDFGSVFVDFDFDSEKDFAEGIDS